jgi:precorrin-2/cobalt-factor-2 C20-methyltransferase
MAKLIGVGVGPGDPELMTLKAVRALSTAPVIAYLAPLEGEGLARRIANAHIPQGRIEIALRMEMSLDRASAEAAYDAGARDIALHLAQGRDVALLCEGDPLLFGSFLYLLDRLDGKAEIEVIPGVSAIAACAARSLFPLAKQDETVMLLPASLPEEELLDRIAKADTVGLFKVGRHLGKIARVLAKLGRSEGAVYIERVGQDGEKLLPLDEAVSKGGVYFAMVLARRNI